MCHFLSLMVIISGDNKSNIRKTYQGLKMQMCLKSFFLSFLHVDKNDAVFNR